MARGILTPAEAQRAKARSRSDMTVGFYTRQASTMNADEIRKSAHGYDDGLRRRQA